jgi:hypothetical protein
MNEHLYHCKLWKTFTEEPSSKFLYASSVRELVDRFLEYGYIAESVPNVGVRLVPVLRLCTDSEYVYLNALNGEILSVE